MNAGKEKWARERNIRMQKITRTLTTSGKRRTRQKNAYRRSIKITISNWGTQHTMPRNRNSAEIGNDALVWEDVRKLIAARIICIV